MVVIGPGPTLATDVMHARTARPSSSTVHAPHCPSPQPYLLPVRSSSSCKTESKLRAGSTSTRRTAPLTWSSRTAMRSPPVQRVSSKPRETGASGKGRRRRPRAQERLRRPVAHDIHGSRPDPLPRLVGRFHHGFTAVLQHVPHDPPRVSDAVPHHDAAIVVALAHGGALHDPACDPRRIAHRDFDVVARAVR